MMYDYRLVLQNYDDVISKHGREDVTSNRCSNQLKGDANSEFYSITSSEIQQNVHSVLLCATENIHK